MNILWSFSLDKLMFCARRARVMNLLISLNNIRNVNSKIDRFRHASLIYFVSKTLHVPISVYDKNLFSCVIYSSA